MMEVRLNFKDKKVGIEQRFFELCKEALEHENLSLYDLEYNSASKLLRVFIFDQKTQTAILEDCVRIDKAITPLLEAVDWAPSDLTLEVSSPGVFRALKTRDHFLWAMGQRINIIFTNSWDDKKMELPPKLKGQKKIRGLVKEVSEDFIALEVDQQHILQINFGDMKKAHLDPDLGHFN